MNIDNWAHLGGGITGFILAKFMLDRAPATPGERKRAYALGWTTAIVVLASFGFMIFRRRSPHSDLPVLRESLLRNCDYLD